MKNVICFCGLPGAGKSYAREHDPNTKYAAHIDVADVYHDYPGIDYANAFGEVINQMIMAMDLGKLIFVEAMFHPESFQRDWVNMISTVNGYEVEYREFSADIKTLETRIDRQYKDAIALHKHDPSEIEIDNRRYKARLDIIHTVTYASGSSGAGTSLS